jgi:transcriptional regulator with XRE-family HTH domain
MLVEIEKGEANPSIAILCKIAAALGCARPPCSPCHKVGIAL